MSLLLAYVLAVAAFAFLILHPSLTHSSTAAGEAAVMTAALMLISVEVLRLVQTVGLAVFTLCAADPVPMTTSSSARIAVLTTIVPEHEPLDMVTKTLRAMTALINEGPFDVWVLDEGDDRDVRATAAALGVHHFTRKGVAKYNSASGQFRTRTKAGNHNAWRSEHGSAYDFVAQVDPDHAPLPQFLQRTIGYFHDPNVAFVVAPQVYGNSHETFVARCAAAQGFVFTGVVQRGGNGLGTPLLIGTNHLYRMTAWDQVGGYQDSIIEDHLTSVVVHGSCNPETRQKWTGVYTPDILAIGEGPTTWTDFFNQQYRWASGVWQILFSDGKRRLAHLSFLHRLCYGFLQSFYPTIALCWVLGASLTIAYLTGIVPGPITGTTILPPWIFLWGSYACWYLLLRFLRRFYLHPDERRASVWWPFAATLFAAPVYVAAALGHLLGKPAKYVVTGKGHLRTPDTLASFTGHLFWASVLGFALVVSQVLAGGGSSGAARIWGLCGVAICAVPPAMVLSEMISQASASAWSRFRADRRRTHQ